MTDVFKVAELLVDNLKQKYGDDVGIVAYYGSYATGDASVTSDLDMFYIPYEGKSVPLYRSFVFQGLPFEFWPVSWEFAQQIASGNVSYAVALSLIANAKVLYSRSPEDLQRFVALQQQISNLQQPDKQNEMLDGAQEKYKTIPFYYENLCFALEVEDVTAIRVAGLEFINAVVDCLALINQQYFNRAWWADSTKLKSLKLQPTKLLDAIQTIMTGNDYLAIEAAASELKQQLRSIILTQQQQTNRHAEYETVFAGYYAGIFEYLNKVQSAIDKQNSLAMTCAAAKLQSELAMMLSTPYEAKGYCGFNIYQEYRKAFDELGFPDLTAALVNGDYQALKALIGVFDQQAKLLFERNAVSTNIFDELEALKGYISGN